MKAFLLIFYSLVFGIYLNGILGAKSSIENDRMVWHCNEEITNYWWYESAFVIYSNLIIIVSKYAFIHFINYHLEYIQRKVIILHERIFIYIIHWYLEYIKWNVTPSLNDKNNRSKYNDNNELIFGFLLYIIAWYIIAWYTIAWYFHQQLNTKMKYYYHYFIMQHFYY